MRSLTMMALFGFITVIGCGSPPDNGARIQFTASGEVLALHGYDFPPAPGTALPGYFPDGWEITFDELLVTFDNITLSENPDLSPTDESQAGRMVAQVTGPWAIDLHKGGPLPGKGGADEQAYPIVTIKNQNKNGNQAFDPTKKYAFGFDIVKATSSAQKLNFDATNTADYATMVQNGWTVLYSGTATYKGGANCIIQGDSSYPFNAPPMNTQVKFKFGFSSPATYINCQNPDLTGAGFPGEEHPRGVQVKANDTVIAQATVHTDHPFWESFEHDTPPHFDQLAARAQNVSGTWTVTLSDVVNDNYTSLTDRSGRPVPWRVCVPESAYSPPDAAPVMHFDDTGIHQPSLSYAAFMTYNQSTQGHLNSDGLCFVRRNY